MTCAWSCRRRRSSATTGCRARSTSPSRRAASSVRGGRYFDPFSTLGYFAAKTTRVGLLTHMAVLPYHHPLELVKRLGTLDVLSGGRVIAGVGVGSLQPEFEVLGHAFDGRGERSDDAIRAIRAAWGHRVPEYHGTHYDFEGFIVEPSGPTAGDRGLGRGPDAPLPAPRRSSSATPGCPSASSSTSSRRSSRALRSETTLSAYSDRHGRPLKVILAPEPPDRPPGPTGSHDRFPGLLRRHRRDRLQRALRPPLAGALLRADGRPQVRGGRRRLLRRRTLRRVRRPAAPGARA